MIVCFLFPVARQRNVKIQVSKSLFLWDKWKSRNVFFFLVDIAIYSTELASLAFQRLLGFIWHEQTGQVLRHLAFCRIGTKAERTVVPINKIRLSETRGPMSSADMATLINIWRCFSPDHKPVQRSRMQAIGLRYRASVWIMQRQTHRYTEGKPRLCTCQKHNFHKSDRQSAFLMVRLLLHRGKLPLVLARMIWSEIVGFF